MPANSLFARGHVPGLRLLIAGLTLTFLFSIGAAGAGPATATNWSRQIVATRASQLYYEGAMRAADQQVKSLKRAHRKTQRQLRKAGRHLRQAKIRRTTANTRLSATRNELTASRLALAATILPAPPADTAATVLPVSGTTRPEAPAIPGPGPTDQEDVDLSPSAPGTEPSRDGEAVGARDVTALEKQAGKQKRTFRKTRNRVRRIHHNIRIKSRSLAAIKRQRRVAISRRRAAEAGLGSRILSMSRLAQRRGAKKTKLRPGSNASFSWPVRGRITQPYGCTGFRLSPPRGSCRHFHDGLDIAGYRGTPIRAAAVGVVSYVGWNPWDEGPRAFMIVVAHPGGFETLYGHLVPTRRVRVGQLVRKGAVLGYMGSTGNSTGSHLHLELRRGRTTLNPLAYL